MSFNIPPKVVAAAKNILIYGGPVAARELKKCVSKDNGSTVKMGAYQKCPIEMFGDRACIIVNADKGEYVLLTADTIQSYKFVKKKKRLTGAGYRTYFYYNITFHDGSESYVRMRRSYRDAMKNSM